MEWVIHTEENSTAEKDKACILQRTDKDEATSRKWIFFMGTLRV